jgi:hypothetical protein
MSVVLAIVVGWVAFAALVGVGLGRLVRRRDRQDHRKGHQAQTVNPADCPDWCVEERFAEQLRNQRGGL